MSMLGLTGGIGSGKSAVAEALVCGTEIYSLDVDSIVSDLLEKGAAGWLGLRNALEERFFFADGAVNKVFLRSMIFTDHLLRSTVEEVIHPLVLERMRALCKVQAQQGNRLCLVEVPLLYEAGWQPCFDAVIVVFAKYEECLARIMDRDRVDALHAAEAIAAQKPLTEKVELADHVIDNSGSWSETIIQIDSLRNTLLHPAKSLKE